MEGRAGAQADSSGRTVEVEIQPSGRVHLVLQMQPVVTMDFPPTNVQLCLLIFCYCLDSLKGSTSAFFGAI